MTRRGGSYRGEVRHCSGRLGEARPWCTARLSEADDDLAPGPAAQQRP